MPQQSVEQQYKGRFISHTEIVSGCPHHLLSIVKHIGPQSCFYGSITQTTRSLQLPVNSAALPEMPSLQKLVIFSITDGRDNYAHLPMI